MQRLGVLVLVLLAAGCLGRAPDVVTGDAGQESPSPAVEGGSPEVAVGIPADVAAGRAPPEWRAGDWWRFRDLEGTVLEIVVTEAGPAGYATAPSEASLAAYDALFDVSYVGRVTRDLAGEQRGTPVAFFRWPLENGTTWTTTWDGLEVELVATASPAVPAPGGAAAGFEIVGSVAGRPHVAYSYAPSAGWWTRIAFDNGTYALELVESGTGYAGPVFSGERRELGRSEAGAGPALAPYWEFAVDEEPLLLRVELAAAAGAPGVARLELAGPGGDDASGQAACTAVGGCVVSLGVDLAPAAGVGKVIQASTMPGEHAVVAVGAYAVETAFPILQ